MGIGSPVLAKETEMILSLEEETNSILFKDKEELVIQEETSTDRAKRSARLSESSKDKTNYLIAKDLYDRYKVITGFDTDIKGFNQKYNFD
ncbi:MAG: hypothetical protein GXZ08_01310 [Tissierellia bacterium]|nr:hypothetical protein [Tissierellia bacterium]